MGKIMNIFYQTKPSIEGIAKGPIAGIVPYNTIKLYRQPAHNRNIFAIELTMDYRTRIITKAGHNSVIPTEQCHILWLSVLTSFLSK